MTLRANAIANLLGSGWSTLMGLAFVPIYISYLGLEAYGLIGVFALLQTWLSLLDLGLTPTLNREMARFAGGGHDAQSIRGLLRSVEATTIAIGLVAATSIAFGASWLATNWLHADRLPLAILTQALVIIGFVVGLRLIEGVYRGGLNGLQRQVSLNVATSILATVRGVGAVAILAFASPTVTAYFMWQAAISTVSVGVFALLVHRAIPPARRPSQLTLDPLRGVWRFAAGSLLVTLLGFVLSQSDKIILTSLLSLSAFGAYTLALTVAGAVRLLGQPIDQAVFPRMTQLLQLNDQAGLASLYHKASQLNAVLVGSAGAFLAVFGLDALIVWTGDPDLARQVYPLLAVLVGGMVLNSMVSGPYYLQLAAGWTSTLVKVNGLLVMVFVPLTYVLVLELQAQGGAFAWLLLNVVYALTMAVLTHRRLLRGELAAWYLKDIALPLAAAVGAAIALRSILPEGERSAQALPVLGLAAGGILAASSLASEVVRQEVTGRIGFRRGRSA